MPTITLFLISVFVIQEKVQAFSSILEGPFGSDLSEFEKELPKSYLRYTLTAEGNEVEILQMHVIFLQHIQGRTAVRNPKRVWENGIIPYKISETFDEFIKLKASINVSSFFRG